MSYSEKDTHRHVGLCLIALLSCYDNILARASCVPNMLAVNLSDGNALCTDLLFDRSGANVTLRGSTGVTLQDDTLMIDPNHRFIVNCTTVEHVDIISFNEASSCLCYAATSDIVADSRLKLQSCNFKRTNQDRLLDFMGAIIQQGGWASAVVFTDTLGLTVWKRRALQLVVRVFACDTDADNLAPVFGEVAKFNDYVNMLVDCEETKMKQLLSMINKMRKSWAHFNWLLYGIASHRQHTIHPYLMEGDNAVILQSITKDIYLDDVLKRTAINPAGVGIYWCLVDCNRPNSTLFMGPYNDVAGIGQLQVILLPAEFSQFYGKHLNVAYMEYKPFVYTKTTNGTKHLAGIEIDVVTSLSQKFNFSFSLVPARDGWGRQKEDGSWDGLIGMVVRGETDMAISGITISKGREEVVDFLFQHWEDASTVLLNIKSDRWYYFLRTFTLPVWLAVIAMPWVIGIVLLTMKALIVTKEPRVPIEQPKNEHLYQPKPRKSIRTKRPSVVFHRPLSIERSMSNSSNGGSFLQRSVSTSSCSNNGNHIVRSNGLYRSSNKRLSVSTIDSVSSSLADQLSTLSEQREDNDVFSECENKPNESSAKSTAVRRFGSHVCDYVFTLYGSIFYQGMDLPVRSVSVRIVIATFWMTMIILVGTYAGSLTASLAITKVKMPFSNLEQLARDKTYIVQMLKGTFREQLFKEATGGLYKELWTKIQSNPKESFVDNEPTAMKKVLNNRGYAYMSDKTSLRELVKTSENCHVMLMKQEFFKSGFAIVVKEGAPYRRQFNKFIVHLFEAGLFKYWSDIHTSDDHCPKKKSQTVKHDVTLNDLTMVFIFILGVGLSTSTFALTLECLAKYINTQKRGQYTL